MMILAVPSGFVAPCRESNITKNGVTYTFPTTLPMLIAYSNQRCDTGEGFVLFSSLQ